MKPNKEQIEVVDNILGIMQSWKNTNDINSLTHNSDIGEELAKLDLTINTHQNIRSMLNEILLEIQKL